MENMMSRKYIFAILGGDSRQAVVAKKLLSLGHAVKICGIDASLGGISGAEIISSPEKAAMGNDVVLLPLPVTRDNTTLNTVSPDNNKTVLLKDILKAVTFKPDTLVFGGMIPDKIKETAHLFGVETVDYYAVDSLQKKNALPSAEGALMVAMQNTDKNIEGMRVLIGGYGRIGKILAEKLKALGAEVTVGARRDEVLCEIAMSGYNAVNTKDVKMLSREFHSCDVVFNTIPGVVFSKQIIENGKGKPLYIEIASSPGGIDLCAARESGIRIIFAHSLPGKYAPVSAGEYIFETVCELLKERGMEL